MTASPNEYDEPWPIDEKRLMAIVCQLPRYDVALGAESEVAIEGEETPGYPSISRLMATEADAEHIAEAAETEGATPTVESGVLGIYAELLAALGTFIEDNRRGRRRGKMGTVRADLRRLDRALTELQGAWNAVNERTKEQIDNALDEPWGEFEARPVSEATAPLDGWARGVYRTSRFRQDAVRMARTVARLKREFDLAPQDRRQTVPGLRRLVDRLAAIFVDCTGRQLSTSRNDEGAMGWIQQVVETLPNSCRPPADATAWVVRDSIKRLNRASCE